MIRPLHSGCTRPRLLGCLLASIVGAMVGCGDSEPAGVPKPPARNPRAASTPPAASSTAPGGAAEADWALSTASSDPKVAEVGGLVFPKPATWIWTATRGQFRTLQYEVPGTADGAGAAELVFNLFRGDDGGPTDMNVDRWVGQFRSPEGGPAEATTSVVERGGLVINLIETAGSYQGMGQPAPRPGQMQLGAIVEAPGRRVFLRIVGPAETVEAARGDFDTMIAGIMPAG